MLQEEEEKEDVKEIKLEHNLTELSTTDRGSSQGDVRISSASQEYNFSMQ